MCSEQEPSSGYFLWADRFVVQLLCGTPLLGFLLLLLMLCEFQEVAGGGLR